MYGTVSSVLSTTRPLKPIFFWYWLSVQVHLTFHQNAQQGKVFVCAWCTPFNQTHYLFEEDALEGAPEVLVEDGVDDGVEGRVGVAQPEGEGEAGSLNLPAK